MLRLQERVRAHFEFGSAGILDRGHVLQSFKICCLISPTTNQHTSTCTIKYLSQLFTEDKIVQFQLLLIITKIKWHLLHQDNFVEVQFQILCINQQLKYLQVFRFLLGRQLANLCKCSMQYQANTGTQNLLCLQYKFSETIIKCKFYLTKTFLKKSKRFFIRY